MNISYINDLERKYYELSVNYNSLSDAGYYDNKPAQLKLAKDKLKTLFAQIQKEKETLPK